MNKKEIIQQYQNFKVDGINETLTQEELEFAKDIKEHLKSIEEHEIFLNNQKKKLQEDNTITFTTTKGKTYTRPKYSVDVDFNNAQKQVIFTHGKSNYKLWFLNSKKELSIVDDVEEKEGVLYVYLSFNVKGNSYKTIMSLNNFLYRVYKKEFNITNKKFINAYLKPYEESNYYKSALADIETDLSRLLENKRKTKDLDVYKKLNKRYNDTKKELREQYFSVVSEETRDVPPNVVSTQAIQNKKSKISKNQSEMKTLWNSMITPDEKAYFIGWLCKHIEKIRIKVVSGGVSDKVLSEAYPDNVYGNKYREKANSSGWDASSGVIRVDDPTSVNSEILNTIDKLSTMKHRNRVKKEQIFNGTELNNLDLTLFILSKYNKYGIKSYTDNLKSQIDVDRLKLEEFDNNEYFDKGYALV